MTDLEILREELAWTQALADKYKRDAEQTTDVVRAAQRLIDEIHLAGRNVQRYTFDVRDNTEAKEHYSFTINTARPSLEEAIANLGDALTTWYQPNGPVIQRDN